jgi:hypothetical protein
MSAGVRLTLADLLRDKLASFALLLGVIVSEYLKSRLAGAPASGNIGAARGRNLIVVLWLAQLPSLQMRYRTESRT